MAVDKQGLEEAAKALYEDDDAWSAAFSWPDLAEGQTSASRYRELASTAISAYLSALPPVDGLEVVAWDVAPKGLPAEPTKSHSFVAEIEKQGGVISPLVTLSQASSVIAGLKDVNEALMRERTSLIETKREQIERLTLKIGVLEAKAELASRQALEDHNG